MSEGRPVDELLDELEEQVGENLKVISYKWLARKYAVSANYAKRVLHTFHQKHPDKCNVVYLLSGYPKDAPKQQLVQLVEGAKLAERKATLESVTGIHVFSVMPKQPKDPLALWSQDHEQTVQLFETMVSSEPVGVGNALETNICGAITCSGAKRDPQAFAARRPAGAPAPQAPPAAKKLAPAKKPAVAAQARPAAAAKLQDSAQKLPTAAEDRAPTGRVAEAGAKKGKGTALAGMWAKAPTAKPQAAKAAEPMALDEDDEEDIGVMRNRHGKRKMVMDDSDDEDAPPRAKTKAASATGPKPTVRTYINDKGEEVTEVLTPANENTAVPQQKAQPPKQAAPKQAASAKSAAQQPKQAAPAKPASKPASGRGRGKAAGGRGKGKQAGIASFFGKK